MFCSKCGNKIEDGEAFCTQCGNPRKVELSQTPPATNKKSKAPLIAISSVALFALIVLVVILITKQPSPPPVPAPVDSSRPSAPVVSTMPSVQPEVRQEPSQEPSEEEISESWKRALWEKSKEIHEDFARICESRGTEWTKKGGDYIIELFQDGNYGSPLVGFRLHSSAPEANVRNGNYRMLRFEDNEFVDLMEDDVSFNVYYNTENGAVDLISRWAYRSRMGYGLYVLANDKWKLRLNYWAEGGGFNHADAFDDEGNSTPLSREEADAMGESLMENHERLVPAEFSMSCYNKAERYVPWENYAAEMSKFLDDFDGINTDLASGEDLPDIPDTPFWDDSYAKLVEEMSQRGPYGLIAFEFTLMDIDLDDTPELIVSVGLAETGYFDRIVYHEGIADEANPMLYFEDWNDIPNMYSIGMYRDGPLRFFRDNKTGDVIFSTLYYSEITDRSDGIDYIYAETGEIYRYITCVYNEGTMHSHILSESPPGGSDSSSLYPDSIIERIELSPNEACDYERGANSKSPSIVKMVNQVLEGFSEVSAPPKYTYKVVFPNDEFQHVKHLDVSSVQNWIYEVAAEYE